MEYWVMKAMETRSTMPNPNPASLRAKGMPMMPAPTMALLMFMTTRSCGDPPPASRNATSDGDAAGRAGPESWLPH